MNRAGRAHLVDSRHLGLQAQLNEPLEKNRRLDISRTQVIVDLKTYFETALKTNQNKKKNMNERLWAHQISEVAFRDVHYSANQSILSRLRFIYFEARY